MTAHHRSRKPTTTEKLNFTEWFYINVMLMHMKNMNKLHQRLLFVKYEFSDIK